MNKYDYYCLTIRKCSNVKTYKSAERVLNDYDYYLNNLKSTQGIKELSINYEVKMNMKKQFNIHVHCTLKVRRDDQVYASPKKGWSIRLELCKSLRRWTSYVGKQRISRGDILLYVKRNLGPANTPQDNVCLKKSADNNEVKGEYIPTAEDLNLFEEYIRDAPNYAEHIRKKMPDI